MALRRRVAAGADAGSSRQGRARGGSILDSPTIDGQNGLHDRARILSLVSIYFFLNSLHMHFIIAIPHILWNRTYADPPPASCTSQRWVSASSLSSCPIFFFIISFLAPAVQNRVVCIPYVCYSIPRLPRHAAKIFSSVRIRRVGFPRLTG